MDYIISSAMRIICSICFIICIYGYLLGQDSNIILDEVLTNKIEADRSLFYIYNGNFIKYYKLEYCIENIEAYKESSEYQNQIKELEQKKKEMFNSDYYTVLKDKFKEIDYDISKRGFDIIIGKNWGGSSVDAAHPPQSIDIDWRFYKSFTIILKGLPLTKKQNPLIGKGAYYEIYFIPLSEKEGSEIEENREDILIYILFTPSEMEMIKYRYCFLPNKWWNEITQQCLSSNNYRIIVADSSSQKVYFDKKYKY